MLQVGVPPSVKPLTWLLCQPHSSVGYPQFYLSGKVVEELSSDLVSQDEVYGVSGIGSAVYFTGSACAGSDISSSIKRCILPFLYIKVVMSFVRKKIMGRVIDPGISVHSHSVLDFC